MTTSASIRLIDSRSGNALEQIAAIRQQLSPSGEVVSSKGKALTERVFGAALSPRQVVDRIVTDVETQGIKAVLKYCKELDQADLTPATLRVSATDLARAHSNAAPEYLQTLRRIRQNILRFQTGVLHHDAVLPMGDHELRLLYRPLQRVGVCIPGGAAAYPSTLLMTVVPAQAAGVEQIAVIAPPTPFGAYNTDLLAACHELGVTEVYRVGGAQGVAMLACGIEGVAPVDKIVGPGNLFVALAKAKVSTRVGIDMLAGPSEVVLLADASANPHYLAADLLSQAEHAPGASILITWAPGLAEKVQQSLTLQLADLERCELARESLEAYGALITVADEAEACSLCDAIAPEHLQIETANPEATLQRIHHAGAVFLGHFSPVAVGDYVAGPSHTLPTGGTARFASGLSANDFRKRTSVISYSATKLADVADDVRRLAQVEGLTAHAHSVDIRLQPDLLARYESGNHG